MPCPRREVNVVEGSIKFFSVQFESHTFSSTLNMPQNLLSRYNPCFFLKILDPLNGFVSARTRPWPEYQDEPL